MTRVLLCLVGLFCLLVSSLAEQRNVFVTKEDVAQMLLAATKPLLDRITALESQNIEKNERIKSLEMSVGKYKHKNSELYGTTSQTRHHSSAGRRPNAPDNLTDAFSNGNQTQSDLDVESNGLYRRRPVSNTGKARVLKTSRRAIENGVAFHVKTVSTKTNLGIDQDIVFDTVITNIGAAFNPNHGVFIAPVAGVYVFAASIMATPVKTVHCSITVNGHHMTSIFAYESNNFNQGAQSLVVHLSAGDDVSVRAIDISGISVYGDSYSSFSGFLLFQD